MRKQQSTKKKIELDIKKLTKKELKIYKAIMNSFPKTAHESAYDVAINGGVNWQFYPL